MDELNIRLKSAFDRFVVAFEYLQSTVVQCSGTAENWTLLFEGVDVDFNIKKGDVPSPPKNFDWIVDIKQNFCTCSYDSVVHHWATAEEVLGDFEEWVNAIEQKVKEQVKFYDIHMNYKNQNIDDIAIKYDMTRKELMGIVYDAYNNKDYYSALPLPIAMQAHETLQKVCKALKRHDIIAEYGISVIDYFNPDDEEEYWTNERGSFVIKINSRKFCTLYKHPEFCQIPEGYGMVEDMKTPNASLYYDHDHDKEHPLGLLPIPLCALNYWADELNEIDPKATNMVYAYI